MTTLSMTDFISVMVENKRENSNDINSTIIFSHNHILKFFETHKKFIWGEDII